MQKDSHCCGNFGKRTKNDAVTATLHKLWSADFEGKWGSILVLIPICWLCHEVKSPILPVCAALSFLLRAPCSSVSTLLFLFSSFTPLHLEIVHKTNLNEFFQSLCSQSVEALPWELCSDTMRGHCCCQVENLHQCFSLMLSCLLSKCASKKKLQHQLNNNTMKEQNFSNKLGAKPETYFCIGHSNIWSKPVHSIIKTIKNKFNLNGRDSSFKENGPGN